MATPFSFVGVLNLPDAPTLPPDPIPINMSGQFTQKAVFVYTFTGTGSQTVDLGTIASPGIKGLLITVDAGTGVPPVAVKINGSSTGAFEISSGGFLALGSPSPVSGTTSMLIAYTGVCTVRIWIVG